MINIYTKSNEDGGLRVVLRNEHNPNLLFFDTYKFEIKSATEFDLSEFKLWDIKEQLVSLDELRNDDFDVFYFRINGNLIFQISWIPFGYTHEPVQQTVCYSNSNNSGEVYEMALSRFYHAEVYEELALPIW